MYASELIKMIQDEIDNNGDGEILLEVTDLNSLIAGDEISIHRYGKTIGIRGQQ